MFQMLIYHAGADEDVSNVIATSGEPIIRMKPRSEDDVEESPPTWPKNASFSAYDIQQCHEASVLQTRTGRPVDALIAPVAPSATPSHGKTGMSA